MLLVDPIIAILAVVLLRWVVEERVMPLQRTPNDASSLFAERQKRFQAKWIPVRVSNMLQNNQPEP